MENSKKSVESYGRFKNLAWFDKLSQSLIFVGGAGGIGSWTTLFLARTGANIMVLDMDTVEPHNIAGQLYGNNEVGEAKVDALVKVVKNLCGEDNLTPLNMEIKEDTEDWKRYVTRCDVVIVGFDNLKARELVYKAWKAEGKEQSMFIDGRLAAESGTIYTLTKQSTEEEFKGYEGTYFSEEERVELPCTMKATSHCGALIGSLITSQVTNWFNNITPKVISRNVGNYEFHLPLMLWDQPELKVKENESNIVAAEA